MRLLIDLIGACFGVNMRAVRLILQHWKIFATVFLLMILGGLGFGTYFYIQQKISDHKVGEVIAQQFQDKYGAEVELEDKLYYSDVINKFAVQGEYLKEISQNSVGAEWYLIRQKGTTPETEVLCIQRSDGQIMDSYPYDKMVGLADVCGLKPYLKSNTLENALITFTDQDLQENFGPVFDTLMVKRDSQDFFSKWDTYIQKLREEETLWRGKEYITVLFNVGHRKNHAYKIYQKEDEKSEQKQLDKLKKWIKKQRGY